jgi:hypothetical protein
MNEISMEKVDDHKYLGIYLDEKLNFTLNTDEVVSKCFKNGVF